MRRDIPALALPLNIALLVWMLVGRGLVVPLGWMVLLGVLASPVLLVCLGIATWMVRRAPHVLTSAQAWAQTVLWAAMSVFGLACVDGGDGGTTGSVLTWLTGGAPVMETVSNVLWLASIVVGIVAWVVLVSASSRARSTPPPPPYPYGGHPPGPGPVR